MPNALDNAEVMKSVRIALQLVRSFTAEADECLTERNDEALAALLDRAVLQCRIALRAIGTRDLCR